METEEFVDIKPILYISINQDSSCFCLGTINGFHVFNISPFKPLHYCGKKINNNKFRIRRRNKNN
jgi:hypothetical protein